MTIKYYANIRPINEEVIGTSAHGTAAFDLSENNLHVLIEMFDTPKNMQHWEHFHGFPDGTNAKVATMKQDINHDGFVDLAETESVSGTTMVPFDATPHEMHIPNDSYPVSDENGYFKYEKNVPVSQLSEQFKEVFNTKEIDLDKRVIYIHGVPNSLSLPETFGGNLTEKYNHHVTLPIAVGKIEKGNYEQL